MNDMAYPIKPIDEILDKKEQEKILDSILNYHDIMITQLMTCSPAVNVHLKDCQGHVKYT